MDSPLPRQLLNLQRANTATVDNSCQVCVKISAQLPQKLAQQRCHGRGQRRRQLTPTGALLVNRSEDTGTVIIAR